MRENSEFDIIANDRQQYGGSHDNLLLELLNTGVVLSW